MRYLITGTAGFIGFHTARKLLSEGHTVTGYDAVTDYYDPDLKRARLAILEQFETFVPVEKRLEDLPALMAAAHASSPQVIIHLAAQAGVRYSIESPTTYVSSNIVGTFNVLEVARELRPDHLLIASTSSIYGGNTDLPFREGDRSDYPVSLYAATKRSTEALAHSYSHLWDVPTTCLRFFTVYGPWGRPDMALFKFVKAIRQGVPIEVYANGEMRRDFTYIDDLVHALVALSTVQPAIGHRVSRDDNLSPIAPFRSVNIGGGAPVALMAFVEAIEAATGAVATKNYLPSQAGDMLETFADTNLLESLIGAKPLTSVYAGVEKFVEWYDYYFGPTTLTNEAPA